MKLNTFIGKTSPPFYTNNRQGICLTYTVTEGFIIAAIRIACIEDKTTNGALQYDVFPAIVITSTGYDANYVFGAISDVGHLSDGRIGVLDRLTATLYVFSTSGDYLFEIGRKGEGPGEFASPDCFIAIGDDSIVIFDKMARRVSLYRDNGEYQGELMSLPGMVEIPRLQAKHILHFDNEKL
ncbi:hypothetical protein CSA37_01085 [Candidatus Fermentibacteria bacterium]|nr:MAG: hypothetical protein CSA37_01085 [Candidatus Fermentibacteria bacterium]